MWKKFFVGVLCTALLATPLSALANATSTGRDSSTSPNSVHSLTSLSVKSALDGSSGGNRTPWVQPSKAFQSDAVSVNGPVSQSVTGGAIPISFHRSSRSSYSSSFRRSYSGSATRSHSLFGGSSHYSGFGSSSRYGGGLSSHLFSFGAGFLLGRMFHPFGGYWGYGAGYGYHHFSLFGLIFDLILLYILFRIVKFFFFRR